MSVVNLLRPADLKLHSQTRKHSHAGQVWFRIVLHKNQKSWYPPKKDTQEFSGSQDVEYVANESENVHTHTFRPRLDAIGSNSQTKFTIARQSNEDNDEHFEEILKSVNWNNNWLLSGYSDKASFLSQIAYFLYPSLIIYLSQLTLNVYLKIPCKECTDDSHCGCKNTFLSLKNRLSLKFYPDKFHRPLPSEFLKYHVLSSMQSRWGENGARIWWKDLGV